MKRNKLLFGAALLFLAGHLWAQKPAEGRITFQTKKAIEGTIKLACHAQGEVSIDGLEAKGGNQYIVKNSQVTLTGAITGLDVSYADVTEIDLSQCPLLDSLLCKGNKLTQLDFSHNPKLQYVNCVFNTLKTINFSGCSDLRWVECNMNQLSELNLSEAPELEYVSCYLNGLKALDVTQNKKLKQLLCQFNKIEDIDIRQNKELEAFTISNNLLQGLDFSQNSKLNKIWAENNNLSSLTYGSSYPHLTQLFVRGNQIKELDLTPFPNVLSLLVDRNPLGKLNLSSNKAIEKLTCGSIGISELDLSHLSQLTELDCMGNSLKTLDVSHNPNLQKLYCDGNQLTALNTSACPKLKALICANNQLSNVDLSKNSALTSMQCFSNKIDAEQMKTFVQNLPTRPISAPGELIIIDLKHTDVEKNVCPKSCVKVAVDKYWNVLSCEGDSKECAPYSGSEETSLQTIDSTIWQWVIDQNELYLSGAAPHATATLYDMQGAQIATSQTDEFGRTTLVLPNTLGVYILQCGQKSEKIVL